MIINFECEVAMPLALTCIEFNFKVPRAGAACTAAVAAAKKKKKKILAKTAFLNL